MKKISILIAILMVASLVLSACAPAATTVAPTSAPTAVPATAAPGATAAPTTAPTAVPAKPTETKEPPYELTVAYMTFGDNPKDLQLVQDELNKLTLAKINATVKLMPISIGSYAQQTNLILTTPSEKLDLFVTSVNRNFTGMAANGQLVAMDDLITKYGPGIKTAMDASYLKAGSVGGKQYAIPTVRDFAFYGAYAMPKDLVEKYKIDVTQVKKFEDLEAIFKTVKDNDPNIAEVIPGAIGSSLLDFYLPYDPLGDKFGVLMNYGAELKVVNLFETPEYASWLKLVRSWYIKGYVLKDIATSKDTKDKLIETGKAFGYINRAKPGYEAQESNSTKKTIVVATYSPPEANTTTVANVMWSIALNSKRPDKAMQFLNLLYSDPQVVNLIDWGIEGKHYVKKGNVIGYPDGVTVANTGYNLGLGWEFGNQFLSYVWENDDPQIWTKMADFNKSATKSKAMGFVFDTSKVKTEFTAVTNVVNQYKLGLETGTTDPETELPKFIAALKSAGIDNIIKEKQAQLDAWAKTQ